MEDDLMTNTTDESESEESSTDDSSDNDTSDDGESVDDTESVVGEQDEADSNSAVEMIQNEVTSDSSDERETCPICLSRFIGQDLGSPESCNHTFCLECVLEWSKNINTCPIDRSEFHSIHVKPSPDGKVVKKIKVKVVPKADEFELPEDTSTCEVCQSGENEDRLLLCDGCDLAYHCECLDPPLYSIPIEEWFCPPCSAVLQNSASHSGHGRQRRVIPRTRASEVVRSRIENLRNFTSSRSAGASSSIRRKPSTSRQVSKKPRKRRRRRYYTKVIKYARTKQSVSNSGKGKGSARNVVLVRCKTRRRRRRKTRVKRLSSTSKGKQPLSSKKRLATQLGLGKPLPGHVMPTVKKSSGSTLISNQPSHSLFGNRNQLMDFSESYDDDALSTNTSIPSSSSRPTSSKQVVSSSPINILDSILAGQELLHKKAQDIVIRQDGSLIIKKEKKCVKVVPKKEMEVKEKIKKANPTHIALMEPNVISAREMEESNLENAGKVASSNSSSMGARPKVKSITHGKASGSKRDQISSSCKSDNKPYNSSRSFKEPYDFSKAGPSSSSHNDKKHRNVLPKPLKITSVRSLSCSSEENADFDDNPFMKKAKRREKLARLSRSDSDGNVCSDFNPVYDRGGYEEDFLAADATRRHTKLRGLLAAEEPSNPYRNYVEEESIKKNGISHDLTKREKSGFENRVKKEKVKECDASYSLAENTTAELLNHRNVLSSRSFCKTYVKREIVSSDEDTYLPDTQRVHHQVIAKLPKQNSLGVQNSSCGKRQDLPDMHNAEKVGSKFANSFQDSSVTEINHNESTSSSSRDQQLVLNNVKTSTYNIKQELPDSDHDENVRHELMDSLQDNVEKLIKKEIIPEQESVKVSLVRDTHVCEKHSNEAKSTLNCLTGERGDKHFEDDHNSRNLSCMLQKEPNQIKKERSNDNDKELPSAKSSPKKTFKLIKIEETNLDDIPSNAEEPEISKLLSSIGVSDVTQLNSFIRDNPLFFNDPLVPALLNMEFLTQCFGNKPKGDPINEKCHDELFRDLPKTKKIYVPNELEKKADSKKEDKISGNLHLPLKILTAHHDGDGSENNPENKYKGSAVKKPMHGLFSEIPVTQLIHSDENNTLNSGNRSSDHFNNSCDLEFPATQRVNLTEQFIKSKLNNESSIKTNYNKNCYINESDGLPATQQIDIFDNNYYSSDAFTKNRGYVNDSLPSKIGSLPKVKVLEPAVENNVNKAKDCFRSKNIFDDFLPATQKMESINAALQNAINRNKKYSENDNSIDELPATQKNEFPEPALANKMIQARKSKYGNFDDLPCTQEIDSFNFCSKTKMNETEKHSKSNNSINKLPATQKAEFQKPASLNKLNRTKFSTNDSLGSDKIGELLVGLPQTNMVGDPVEKFFNYMQESFDEFPATQLIQPPEKKLENKISQAEKFSTEVLQATQMNLLTDDLPESDMKHNFNEELFNNIMHDSYDDLPATQAILLPSQKSQGNIFSSKKSPATLGKECTELNAESKPKTNSIKRKSKESRCSLDELTNTQSVLSPVSNNEKDIRKCSDKDVSKIRREVKTNSYSQKLKSKEDILKPRPKISQLNDFNKLPETQDSRCSLSELPDTQSVLSPVSNREKDLRKCSDKDVSKIRREDKTNSYSQKLKSKEDILKARPKISQSNDFNKLPDTQAVLVFNHRKLYHQKFVRKAEPTDVKPSRKQKHDLTHHASQNAEISHTNEDVVVHTHNEKPPTQTDGSDNSHNDDASRRNTESETNAQVVETNKDMHSPAEMEETSENSEELPPTQPMKILDGLSPLEAQMLMKQCGIQAMALKSANRQSAVHRNLPTVVASVRSKVLPKPKGSLKVSYSDSVADVLCLTDVRTRTDSESSSDVLKTASLCVDNVKKECNSDNETVSSDHEDDDIVLKHLTVETVMCVDNIKKEIDNSNDVENHLDLTRKCHNVPKTMVDGTNLKAKNQQLVAQDSVTRSYKEVLKDKTHDGKIDPFTTIEKRNIDLKRIANDSHPKNKWDNNKRTSEAERLLQDSAKNAQLQDFLNELVGDDDDVLPATQLVIPPAGMQHTRYPSQDVSLRRDPDIYNRTSDKRDERHTNVIPHDSQSFKSNKMCTNNSKTVSQRDHKHSSIVIKTEAVSDDAACHTVDTEVNASIKVKQEVLSDVDDYNCTSKQIKLEVLSDDEVIPIDIDTVSNANQELSKKIKVKCKVISDGVGEVASGSTEGMKKQNLIQRIKTEPGLNEVVKCYRKEAHKDVRKLNDPLSHNVNVKGEILSDDSSTGGSCRTEKSIHRQVYKSTDRPVQSHQLTSMRLNKSNSQSHTLFNHSSVTTCEVVNETKRSEAVAIVKPVKRKHSSRDQNSVMHSDKFNSESERCKKINQPNSASKADISVDKKHNLSSHFHSTSAPKTHMTRVVRKPLCSPNPNDRILEKANRLKVSENSVKIINLKAAVTVKAEKHKYSFTEDSSDVSHDNIKANHKKNYNKKYSSSSKRYKTDTSPHSRHESYLSDSSSQSKSRSKYSPKEAERRSSVSSRASNSSHSRSSPHKSNRHCNVKLEHHASKSKDKKYLNSEFKDKRRNGKMDDLDLSSNSSNSKNLIVPKSEGDASSQFSNLRKADLKEMIAEEVKTVLKPFYMAMLISKEDYKDIMRRAVPKIFLNSRKSIDREKIEKLVKQYISYIND